MSVVRGEGGREEMGTWDSMEARSGRGCPPHGRRPAHAVARLHNNLAVLAVCDEFKLPPWALFAERVPNAFVRRQAMPPRNPGSLDGCFQNQYATYPHPSTPPKFLSAGR